MRRRTVIKSSAFAALGALSAAGLASCGDRTATSSGPANSGPSEKVLRIAMVPWVGWSRAHLAEVKGFFEEEGLKVEQIIYETVTEVNEALVNQDVDLGWIVAADMVVMADEAPSLKFVMASDYSGDVDAIVGRGISSAEEARGKKFAREDVPFQIVFLNSYLQSIGLSEQDVEIVSLPVPDAAEALTNQEVDAIAAYEPFVSNVLKQQSDATVLFSAQGTNTIVNGLAGHSPVLQSRRQDIIAYMRALNKALDFANENPDEAYGLIAEWVGSTPEETTEIMGKLKLMDLEANKSIAFDFENPLNIANSFDSAVPILVSAGKATSEVPGISFVDASFVEAL